MASYGKRIRTAVAIARQKSSRRYYCKGCSRIAVTRISSGVWQCKKCHTTYASGMYGFGE